MIIRILSCLNCEADFWTDKPRYYCNHCSRLPKEQLKQPTDNTLMEEWE